MPRASACSRAATPRRRAWPRSSRSWSSPASPRTRRCARRPRTPPASSAARTSSAALRWASTRIWYCSRATRSTPSTRSTRRRLSSRTANGSTPTASHISPASKLCVAPRAVSRRRTESRQWTPRLGTAVQSRPWSRSRRVSESKPPRRASSVASGLPIQGGRAGRSRAGRGMNRRGSQRIKRRIPCEFDYDGHTYAGIVVDLSSGGMFLQTDTAIDPGSELAVRLRPERAPEIEVRGRVVRRRFTPAVLASMIRRGVGVHLLHPPQAYFELLGIEPEPDAEQLWGATEDWEPDLQDDPAAGPIAIDIQIGADEPPELTSIAEEPDAPGAAEPVGEWSFERGDTPPPVEQKPEPPLDEQWESLASEAVPAAPVWPPEALCRADALLIDGGELDDVHELLEKLGSDPVRLRTADTHRFTGWEQPPRVVVASARSALRLSVGPNVEAQGIVTIAILDTDSQVVCGMLRRQGFRYIVRRPVHREALRLLLLRALFRGRE